MGWELIGGDPAPGDPSAISSSAVGFATTADDAEEVRDPPTGPRIEGNPTSVTKDTPSSDLSKPDTGDVHLAFCPWEKGHPNADTVIRPMPAPPPAP
jgi:hypothetical protein